MSQIYYSPAQLNKVLSATDGAAAFQFNNGQPPPLSSTDCNAGLVLALTPSNTTATYYFTATGQCTLANCTATQNFCYGSALGVIRHFRAWARRKSGTSGAIAAQKVIFQCHDGSGFVEVGRLNVGAAEASATAEPVSGVVDLPLPLGDTRFSFASGQPAKVIFESADTDVEIVIEAHGKAS